MDNKFRLQKDKALRNLDQALLECDVDLGMLPLIDFLNSLDDYYTTSSCTGRTVLFFDPGTKLDSGWIGKWHREVTFPELKKALVKIPKKGIIWFLHEPTILHVACRSPDAASKLVDLARNSGYKKAGILSLKDDRIIVEVCGTERIDAPVAINGKRIASDAYVKELVRLANHKFASGSNRLTRFQEALISLKTK